MVLTHSLRSLRCAGYGVWAYRPTNWFSGTVYWPGSGGTPHCDVNAAPSKYGVTTYLKKIPQTFDFINEVEA